MTASPEILAALAELRGLRPPPDPGGVRLDVLAAIGLGLAAAGLIVLVRAWLARRRMSVRRAALAELAAARDLDPEARRVAQARLLRRLARTLGGDEAVRPDADRSAALDRLFATDFFSRGAGRALTRDLYARGPAPDPAAINAGLNRLLARIRA